jgi:hypothetical protein
MLGLIKRLPRISIFYVLTCEKDPAESNVDDVVVMRENNAKVNGIK